MAKRPKKPPSQAKLSAWTLFVRENYSRVASENPTVPARGMLSEVKSPMPAGLKSNSTVTALCLSSCILPAHRRGH